MADPKLGNLDPTPEEWTKMRKILEALRRRFRKRDFSLGVPYEDREEGVLNLNLKGFRGKAPISAYVREGVGQRCVSIWRHPAYRYDSDSEFLWKTCDRLGVGLYPRKATCPEKDGRGSPHPKAPRPSLPRRTGVLTSSPKGV